MRIRANSTDPDSKRNGAIPRTYLTLREPGLYQLIFQSRKSEAEKFKRWVTHEVLPAIRAKGYYVPEGHEARVVAELQAQLQESRAALAEVRDHMAQLESQLIGVLKALKQQVQESTVQVIGKETAKREILMPLCSITDLYSYRRSPEEKKAWRSKRKVLEVRLRERCHMAQRGPWAALPKVELDVALKALREYKETALEIAQLTRGLNAVRPEMTQQKLPLN